MVLQELDNSLAEVGDIPIEEGDILVDTLAVGIPVVDIPALHVPVAEILVVDVLAVHTPFVDILLAAHVPVVGILVVEDKDYMVVVALSDKREDCNRTHKCSY